MFGNDCDTRRDRWRMRTAVHGGCYTIGLGGRRGGRSDAYSSGKTKKIELRGNITIKAIVFSPVTPPCCGTGLSLTFPDHQGESSGRQRGLLERQEGRICWRTRRCVWASHDDVLAAALFKSTLLSFKTDKSNSYWFYTCSILSNRCFSIREMVQTFISEWVVTV